VDAVLNPSTSVVACACIAFFASTMPVALATGLPWDSSLVMQGSTTSMVLTWTSPGSPLASGTVTSGQACIGVVHCADLAGLGIEFHDFGGGRAGWNIPPACDPCLLTGTMTLLVTVDPTHSVLVGAYTIGRYGGGNGAGFSAEDSSGPGPP